MKITKIEKVGEIFLMTKTPNLLQKAFGAKEQVERYKKYGTLVKHTTIFIRSDGEIMYSHTKESEELNKFLMETKKKCVITRYDETITEPPFETIEIDEMEIIKPSVDHLGEQLYLRLLMGCMEKGYRFKFYTTSENKEFDYEVVVY